jgi:hypothetical protein
VLYSPVLAVPITRSRPILAVLRCRASEQLLFQLLVYAPPSTWPQSEETKSVAVQCNSCLCRLDSSTGGPCLSGSAQ